MKVLNVLNCMQTSWYDEFKSITPKSISIPLPKPVLNYFLSDGTLVLPSELSDKLNTENQPHYLENEASDIEECVKAPSFPEFTNQIEKSISQLGGAVLPKLNWSSPSDATWISYCNSMKCSSPKDVYLLVKGSDKLTRDLTSPFSKCVDERINERPNVTYYLTLRRWMEINPGSEFRCFVKNNKLIAISQRHYNTYYPFLNALRHDIIKEVCQFFNCHIKAKFLDTDFVFDIYRKNSQKIYLIDFNPFGLLTDALLFTWDELHGVNQLESSFSDITKLPAFRVNMAGEGIQPNERQMSQYPQDFIDLSAGTDPHKLIDFINLKIQENNENTSSSDDNT